MSIRFTLSVVTLLALAACSGCTMPVYHRRPGDVELPSERAKPSLHAPSAAQTDPQSEAATSNDPLGSTSTGPASTDIAPVLAELESIGRLDPELKRQLVADLGRMPPEQWGPTINIYRMALSYRKQMQQKEAAKARDPGRATLVSHQEELKPAAPPAATSTETKTTAPSRAPETKVAANLQPATSTAAALPEPRRIVADPTPLQLPLPGAELGHDQVDLAQTRRQAATTAELASGPNDRYDQSIDSASPPIRVEENHQRGESWETYLERAIADLEQKTKQPPRSAGEVRRHAQLRMLYLLAGRRDDALRPIEGISATQQDYWSKQIFGLDIYLDSQRNTEADRRAAEAHVHLTEAVSKLSELGTLSVRNLAFCDKVVSYGIYDTYETHDFKAGQTVLLYTEIENFACRETKDGFETTLRSSYQILDSRGTRADEHDFAETKELCRNRRRDFFMRYFVELPEQIYPGSYTLKLTIEDANSQKIGQASIDFRVVK